MKKIEDPADSLEDIAKYANNLEASDLEFLTMGTDEGKNIFRFVGPGLPSPRGELKIQAVADMEAAKLIKGLICGQKVLLKTGAVFAAMYREAATEQDTPPAATVHPVPAGAIAISPEQIRGLAAQNAQPGYLKAFENATAILAPYGINVKPLRLAHFMAQVLHETGGLRVLRESMDYRAERLPQVWPNHFSDPNVAKQYAHNEEKLANFIYGSGTQIGHDLGNTQPGDGWRFVGRGLMQVTGRESYAKYGSLVGADLIHNPDLAFDPAYSLKIAAEEWNAKGCNSWADADNINKITKLINGGYNGLDERKAWYKKTSEVWD